MCGAPDWRTMAVMASSLQRRSAQVGRGSFWLPPTSAKASGSGGSDPPTQVTSSPKTWQFQQASRLPMLSWAQRFFVGWRRGIREWRKFSPPCDQCQAGSARAVAHVLSEVARNIFHGSYSCVKRAEKRETFMHPLPSTAAQGS